MSLSAVELLLVFIALEISSISTYIMAGYRKRNRPRALKSALKYFLLGSFATAFFLYGIALIFGATGTTQHRRDRRRGWPSRRRRPISCSSHRPGHDPRRHSASRSPPRPSMSGPPTSTKARRRPSSRSCPPRPKAAAFAVLLRIAVRSASGTPRALGAASSGWLAVLSMTIGNLGALRQQQCEADARLLLDRARRLHPRCLHRALARRQSPPPASTPSPTRAIRAERLYS